MTAERDEPGRWLADGFAAQVGTWADALGTPAAARAQAVRAARALSLATAEGHVCLPLDALAPEPDEGPALRAALLASGVVAAPADAGAHPLILDADDRLYLQRDHDFECRLARRLVQAAQTPALAVPEAAQAELHARFGRRGLDWQKLAAALALQRRLTVISGGPGTGKTSTVVNLLACLIAQAPGCRIALAAPTGKAAARLSEALRERAAHLPESLRDALPTESFTVHRLLGITPDGEPAYHAGRPLALDVLVVDEASMLDLALATRLLEAVPGDARILLLGDKDQLAAVESGAVFAELSADPSLTGSCRAQLAALCELPPDAIAPPPPARTSALRDSVVWFTQNYRFGADSGIGRLAAHINAGRPDAALAGLRAGADVSVKWLPDSAGAFAEALAGHAPYLQTVLQNPADAAGALRAFGAFSVLCAVHDGPHGMAALNERIERHARERLAALARHAGGDAAPGWYPGRPVMVLRNDSSLGLFNGDVGIALPDVEGKADGRLRVCFPASNGGLRAVAPARLPPHQSAFAITVHKSQGSEFERVLVLLPARASRVLTRELLYTAITRARSQVLLAGSAEVLAAAIRAPTRRHSGLLARLAEAATGG